MKLIKGVATFATSARQIKPLQSDLQITTWTKIELSGLKEQWYTVPALKHAGGSIMLCWRIPEGFGLDETC